jgi:O-acetyl-ADP-ribose deacetylase (regulator of RNase III)
MLTIIDNNLLTMADNGDFDIICHGANCFHTMASGIAGQIVKKWPEVAIADRQTKYGTRNKLGAFSEVDVVGANGCGFTIINAYTQFTYGRGKDIFEYGAFETFLNRLFVKVYVMDSKSDPTTKTPVRIGFPMIGCGLAGGNPDRVLASLNKFAEDLGDMGEVTVVKFSPAVVGSKAPPDLGY